MSLSFNTQAQNLVLNGDFETYSVCPSARSTYPGNMQINYAVNWHSAASTPDYYNACSGVGTNVNVPYSNYGYQKDCCGGSGFVGGSMLSKYASNNDDREYIITKLSDTLKAGHKYLASMYISRADGWDYAVSSLGMLFTDTLINLPFPQSFINASPQIKNMTLLTDTNNWVLIQDTMLAIGSEVYLTIGNFNTSATSDSVNVGGNGTHSNFAYYYIDGVSVYDVAAIGVNNIESKKTEISIFPNPNNGAFQVYYDLKEKATMEITDISGKLVSTFTLPYDSYKIQFKDEKLETGMYLYRIVSDGIVLKTGKVAVMK